MGFHAKGVLAAAQEAGARAAAAVSSGLGEIIATAQKTSGNRAFGGTFEVWW